MFQNLDILFLVISIIAFFKIKDLDNKVFHLTSVIKDLNEKIKRLSSSNSIEAVNIKNDIEEKIQRKVDIPKKITPLPPKKVDSYMFNWIKENWTIAIGALFLIIGIVSFALYLSIYLNNIFRLGLLCTLASGFLASAPYIEKFLKSETTKYWFMSMGITILFGAAIGASYLDDLKVIDNPFYKIFPLLAVLVVNATYSFSFRKTLLSGYLIFLNTLTLSYLVYSGHILETDKYFIYTLSVILCGFSVLSHKTLDKIFSIILFSAFNYVWLYTFSKHGITPSVNIALISMLSVFCLSTYYFRLFKKSEIDKNALLFHLLAWICLAGNLWPYRLGTPYLFAIFLSGGAIVLSLAIFALMRKEEELFLCDWSISNILILGGIWLFFTKSPFLMKNPYDLIFHLSSVFLLLSSFYLNKLDEKKALSLVCVLLAGAVPLFYYVGLSPSCYIYAYPFSILITFIYIFDHISGHFGKNKIYDFMKHLNIGFIIIFFMEKTPYVKEPISHLLPIIMALPIVMFVFLTKNKSIISMCEKFMEVLFSITTLFLLKKISLDAPSSLESLVTHYPSLFLAPIVFLCGLYKTIDIKNIPLSVTLSSFICFCSYTYILFSPINPVMPSVICLLISYMFYGVTINRSIFLSLGFVEYLGLGEKSRSLPLGLMGYLGFVVFSIINALDENLAFSMIPIRVILSALSFVMGALWLIVIHKENLESKAYIHFEKVVFAYTLFAIFLNTSYPWQPFIYGLFALFIIFSEKINRNLVFKNAYFYSLFLFILSSLSIFWINRFYHAPLPNWYHQAAIPSIFGFISLLIGSVLNAKKTEETGDKIFFQLLNIIPLFLSFAIFIFDYFDRTYVSISWLLLSVLLVFIAFYLKGATFLKIGYGCILGCIFKMIAFDMSHLGFLQRSTILLVSGGILIMLHMFYKKFDYLLMQKNKN